MELKENKHENVKLKEEDVPGAILPREKPEECIVKQLQIWLLSVQPKQRERKRSSYKRVSDGLTDMRKTVKNLVDSRRS